MPATSSYGPAPSLTRLAAELNATHIVSGRVTAARAPGRVTIDAQILHIARGQVVWTRQFADLDANVPETFQEVGQHVANGSRNRGNRRDEEPSDLINDTDPVELTLRGWRDLDRRKVGRREKGTMPAGQAACRNDDAL